MAMVASSPLVSYEEARKQRMEENKLKMEALGLFDLSKSLKPAKKEFVRRPPNSRKVGEFASEARRSSRVAGKPAISYRDQLDLLPGMRFRSASRDRQPLARRYLSDVARMAAIDAAEEVFKTIKNPAFVKPMLHSHTASGFWLGLPANFCKEYLPLRDDRIILQDDKDEETECVYLANKVGLSGGWRGWSLDHELVDGDCCIFELVEPLRFKVYIFRCEEDYEEPDVDVSAATEMKKVVKVSDKKAPLSAPPDLIKGGRKLSTSSTRKLDLEDGEEKGNDEVKKVKREVEDSPTRSSKRKRVKEEDDVVAAPQISKKKVVKVKKEKKDGEDVIELEDEDEDEDFQKPAAQSKDTQPAIRSFGRITRNSAAKLLSKKSE